jgi:hypothetical protein
MQKQILFLILLEPISKFTVLCVSDLTTFFCVGEMQR